MLAVRFQPFLRVNCYFFLLFIICHLLSLLLFDAKCMLGCCVHFSATFFGDEFGPHPAFLSAFFSVSATAAVVLVSVRHLPHLVQRGVTHRPLLWTFSGRWEGGVLIECLFVCIKGHCVSFKPLLLLCGIAPFLKQLHKISSNVGSVLSCKACVMN